MRKPDRRDCLLASVLTTAGNVRSVWANTEIPIEQPSVANAMAFMARAEEMRQLALRQGDQGFGAVLVKNDLIIGQSASRVVVDRDPTAHAETMAIRDAARRGHELNGAILYSTSRPCSMCQGVAAWVGVRCMIHGRDLTDAGAPRAPS